MRALIDILKDEKRLTVELRNLSYLRENEWEEDEISDLNECITKVADKLHDVHDEMRAYFEELFADGRITCTMSNYNPHYPFK